MTKREQKLGGRKVATYKVIELRGDHERVVAIHFQTLNDAEEFQRRKYTEATDGSDFEIRSE
jgi:hypothetical protein